MRLINPYRSLKYQSSRRDYPTVCREHFRGWFHFPFTPHHPVRNSLKTTSVCCSGGSDWWIRSSRQVCRRGAASPHCFRRNLWKRIIIIKVIERAPLHDNKTATENWILIECYACIAHHMLCYYILWTSEYLLTLVLATPFERRRKYTFVRRDR